jgi:phosphotransferase system HPr (HPr) family protein
MNKSGPLKRTVVVANPMGLHMRPATAFAQLARSFGSKVTVWNGSARADGKSSLDLILLVAMPGSELVLEVEGDDAPDAIEQLAEVLASPGSGPE